MGVAFFDRRHVQRALIAIDCWASVIYSRAVIEQPKYKLMLDEFGHQTGVPVRVVERVPGTVLVPTFDATFDVVRLVAQETYEPTTEEPFHGQNAWARVWSEYLATDVALDRSEASPMARGLLLHVHPRSGLYERTDCCPETWRCEEWEDQVLAEVGGVRHRTRFVQRAARRLYRETVSGVSRALVDKTEAKVDKSETFFSGELNLDATFWG